MEEAKKGSIRKLSNLKGKRVKTPVLNFGGQTTELWTEGGEERFIRDMIIQSKQFAESVYCFSTLVSKKSHLKKCVCFVKENTRGKSEKRYRWDKATSQAGL